MVFHHPPPAVGLNAPVRVVTDHPRRVRTISTEWVTLTDGCRLAARIWLPEDADVTPDHEHDRYAWWPSEIDEWPPEAEESLRRMARWLSE